MNFMRTTLLLAGMTALFLFIGNLLGGKSGMVLALLLAGGMNFAAYWFSDKMVLSMFNAREVGPREAPQFYAIVEELARRANTPMPRVYLIDDPNPNAFATGRDPAHAAVAATTGILRILTHEELAGVMAHELGHVLNRDILVSTIAATMAGAITTLANILQWGAIFGGNRDEEGEGGAFGGLAAIVLMILAPIAASLIQMAISRSREYGADELGGRLCGNPLWLANALRKLELGNQQQPMRAADEHPATAHLFIVNPLSGGSIANLFSTHPPIPERMARLQALASTMRR